MLSNGRHDAKYTGSFLVPACQPSSSDLCARAHMLFSYLNTSSHSAIQLAAGRTPPLTGPLSEVRAASVSSKRPGDLQGWGTTVCCKVHLTRRPGMR